MPNKCQISANSMTNHSFKVGNVISLFIFAKQREHNDLFLFYADKMSLNVYGYPSWDSKYVKKQREPLKQPCIIDQHGNQLCTCSCCETDPYKIEPLVCQCKCNRCRTSRSRRKDNLQEMGYLLANTPSTPQVQNQMNVRSPGTPATLNSPNTPVTPVSPAIFAIPNNPNILVTPPASPVTPVSLATSTTQVTPVPSFATPPKLVFVPFSPSNNTTTSTTTDTNRPASKNKRQKQDDPSNTTESKRKRKKKQKKPKNFLQEFENVWDNRMESADLVSVMDVELQFLANVEDEESLLVQSVDQVAQVVTMEEMMAGNMK
jgi:hypothetical protein